MRTIISLLKNAVKKFPQSNYLTEKTDANWQSTTFEQTEKKSDLFAIGLLNKGYKNQDKIAILSEGRTKWVIGEFGILKTRAISIPLSIKLTSDEILFRLNHSQAKAILVSHNNIEKVIKIIDKIEKKNFEIIYLDNDLGFLKTLEDKYKHFSVKKHISTYEEIIKNANEVFDELKPKLNNLINKIDENDIVNISYTSGTTGNPKGIMLTHLNYYANSKASTEAFNIPANSKMFVILPIDHSFAHTAGTFVGLQIPMNLYFLDTRGGSIAALKNIPINIKEVRPNIIFTVPALSGSFMKNIKAGVEKKGTFAKWLFYKGLNAGILINGNAYNKPQKSVSIIDKTMYKLADKLIFKKIRENFGGEILFCVGGGALLDIKQQEFFYTIGMPIYQGYGLTEATPVISANTPEMHKLGSSGKVLNNIDCKIINNNKKAATGEKGEIFIKADSVMKGYYKNNKATSEVLRDGGLYTGDLGYFDKDNFLVVTGRAKALLISEDGEKYSPEEIENTISNVPFVKNAMLYNDHSKFTTAIIDIDINYINSFLKNNNIKNEEELLSIIKQSINEILKQEKENERFQQKWLPKIIRFPTEPFSEDNKMINSTMKMVRYKITETYKNIIDQMYLKSAKENDKENLKILKKFFNFNI